MKKVYGKKEGGIASTVGTIFALLIFTALLGMFMTQVVPVTMKDNEARHDAEVLSQLSQLRSEVDILTLTRDENYTAYVPIKLGADGVPLFASPTYGQLSLYPSKLSSNYVMNVSFKDKYGYLIGRGASGSLQFIAPNKYYVPEMFEYANGALIRYNFNAKKAVFDINPNMRFQSVSLGSALNLSGKANSYANTPYNSVLDITGPLTIEAWIYIKSGGSSQTIISHGGQYVLWIKNNNAIRFADTHGHFVDTAPLPSNYFNRWIHVVGVFSGHMGDALSSSNAQIYINGNPMGVNWGGQWSPTTTSSGITIGYKFNGYIDEIRIFNRALSEQEIQDDYYAGAHYPERNGAVVWYHCDNLTNSGKLYDSGPYHIEATLYNANLVERMGVNIALTLQNIFGKPDSITGTETRNIAIRLYGVSDESYSLNGGLLNITFADYYRYSASFSLDLSDYWINYVNETFGEIGLKYGVDYTIIPSEGKITIYGANDVNIKTVYLSFSIER